MRVALPTRPGFVDIVGDQPDSLREGITTAGERQWTLVEDGNYQYILTDAPGTRLSESSVVKRSVLSVPTGDMGSISIGSFVGRLVLRLEDADGTNLGELCLEVTSRKLDYETEYLQMLGDILGHASDLLLDVQSSLRVPIAPELRVTEEASLQQHLAFLRNIIRSRDFHSAMQQVLLDPRVEQEPEVEWRPAHRVRRLTRQGQAAFGSVTERIPIPRDNPLYGRLAGLGPGVPSMPTRFASSGSVETLDNNENRFVSSLLVSFATRLDDIARVAPRSAGGVHLRAEARTLLSDLDFWQSQPLLADLHGARQSWTVTQALQRRPGYRELYQIWTKYNLSMQVTWDALDDAVDAGKRDNNLLYEYWLFFELLAALTRVTTFRNPSETLFKSLHGGLSLRLRTGRALQLIGRYFTRGVEFNIRFAYNWTFPAATPVSHEGSWSRAMRPDYTISVWPAQLDSKTAEATEQIRHLHFDAKYRSDSLSAILGPDEPVDDASPDKGVAKRTDLLKMHAYKDSIRRSLGAYVLFPGTNEYSAYANDPPLPGIGAVAVRPGADHEHLEFVCRELIGAVGKELASLAGGQG